MAMPRRSRLTMGAIGACASAATMSEVPVGSGPGSGDRRRRAPGPRVERARPFSDEFLAFWA